MLVIRNYKFLRQTVLWGDSMLRRIVFAAFASLLLAACGRGSEDFAVNVGRPVDRVASAFDGTSVDPEISGMFPGLKVVRTRPAKNEILYTIPGNGEFEATIKLTFVGSDDGQSTVIHGAVDVPSTEVTYDGKSMVISETKVEIIIRALMRSAAKKLEAGKSVEEERRDFSRMLTVLAIITDSKKLRLAQDISKYPEWYMAGLGWLSGLGDSGPNPYGEYVAGDDPGYAARQDEYRQESAERAERAQAEENSRPMDSAQGDSAYGDDASDE